MLVLRRVPQSQAQPVLASRTAAPALRCGGSHTVRVPFHLGGRTLRVDIIADEKCGTVVLRVRRGDGSIAFEVKGREEQAEDNAFIAIALDLLEGGDTEGPLGRLADLLGDAEAA